MRKVDVTEITKNVKEMCIEANHFLSEDMKKVFEQAVQKEKAPLGRQVLNQLKENLEIAGAEMIPICQDTGMAVIFMKVGQEVHFDGGNLTEAVNEGVRQGYVDGYLRKSVVKDPIYRDNTKDNTPAVIHYEIVEGDRIDITLAPKGFGSENMSAMRMFTPAASWQNIEDWIVSSVSTAGSNPCPPVIVGVGLGGTIEQCALEAKKALMMPMDTPNPDEFYGEKEQALLEHINRLGIGPQGMGGRITALAVRIRPYATHIAGLPCVVNMSCHVTRHASGEL